MLMHTSRAAIYVKSESDLSHIESAQSGKSAREAGCGVKKRKSVQNAVKKQNLAEIFNIFHKFSIRDNNFLRVVHSVFKII